MTTLELIQAVNKKASQVKKDLTKSFFSGDKTYYNNMVASFPKMPLTNDVYENINNLSAKYAQSLEY